ncbi:serine/threonine-protein kinase [Streptomyces sp. NBC_01317]|uniref:serine/threonine-protein kinase n=1 Tax=Streptomyces sp. NBC_01317 TaxID=2903822 RepID=UPI002E13A6E9|nr:serine/threonine-protein kinase [Streptomyces sp. NBC_01317]
MPLSAVDPESVGGYRLLDRLGSGGMGVVYLASSASGMRVAVKVVHAQLAGDDEFRTRFKQEVAAARRVSGAFTASVVDADPDAVQPWMATLYMPGPTLSHRVGGEGPLPPGELRRLALGLVEALDDIHRADVVHRDLKPANVLMARDGPRVIDFGISRAADHQSYTTTGRVLGTPPFMSPEQLNRPREVTAASDVFSLGALLMYAATGRGPFDDENPYLTMYRVVHEQPLLDGVAQPLRRIVERCLAKEPAGRPGLGELAKMLEELPEDGEWDVPAEPVPAAGDIARATVDPRPAADPAPTADPTPTTDPPPTAGPTPTTGPASTANPTAMTDPTPTTDSTPTVGPAPAAGAESRPGRSFRRRVSLAAAAAFTVAGLGAGAALLTNGSGDDPAPAGGRPAPPATSVPSLLQEAALPAGWKPWYLTLPSSNGNGPFAAVEGCRAYELAVYCWGDGFSAARVDAASGKVVWRVPYTDVGTPSAIDVRSGQVLVVGPASGDGLRADLVVLDRESGKPLWTKRVANHPAVFFGGAVLFRDSFSGGALVARDAATGERRWSTPLPEGAECVPLVSGAVPYAVCTTDPDGRRTTLLRLDPEKGTPEEVAQVKGAVHALGIVGGALHVLVPDGGPGMSYSALVKVDVRTGDRRTVELASRPDGRPSAVGGLVVFVQQTGRVTAVDPDTGDRVWSRETGVDLLGPPMASEREGALYLSSYSGRLVALDLRTGAKRWQTAAMGTSTSGMQEGVAPMRTGGAIVTLANGSLRSVDPLRPHAGE